MILILVKSCKVREMRQGESLTCVVRKKVVIFGY